VNRRDIVRRVLSSVFGSAVALAATSSVEAATECQGVTCRSGTCTKCSSSGGPCAQNGYYCRRCSSAGCGALYWTATSAVWCGYCGA